jgi:acyl-homoserine lactone acylase PvdQ
MSVGQVKWGAIAAVAAVTVGAVAVGAVAVTGADATVQRAAANDTGTDHAAVALNILPAGQYGAVPPPPEATGQAERYDALTPRFDDVTDADLTRYFKSEALGTTGQGPLHEEHDTPRGVRVVRDRDNVPHIFGTTHDAVTVGAGWVTAEDRGLLLEQARYNARVAAIDAPGLNGLDLIARLQKFEPSAQTEAEVANQTKVLEAAGAKGRAVLHDIDQYVKGINEYYAAHDNPAKPWTRTDIYALNALKGQFVGEGGGAEAKDAMFLDALTKRLGPEKGVQVFDDLREADDPETQASVPGSVSFQPPPRSRAGNVIIDAGSFQPVVPGTPIPGAITPATASNAILVSGDRSRSGHPIMVAGPQIGYFYPGLVLEMDLHGPGIHARGSTSAPFPGYILIGRTEDYAWSLTSAGLDIIDTYAEKLCDNSDTKYEFDGSCRDMTLFDAGSLNGTPVTFYRTVHGPVIGYATVKGVRVALASKRASYGRDVLDQLFYRDLTLGKIRNVDDFFHSADQTPQTFNSFYLDDRNIAVFTSGNVPIRPPDVDPALPTDGSGKHEWKGGIGFAQHPRGTNPPDGEIVNWNNKAQGGYRAADDNWALGSIQRVEMLTDNIGAAKQTPGSLVAAMNAAATQDVRIMQLWPVLREVLATGSAPTPLAAQMVRQLDEWRKEGGSRLDRDGDGKIDAPGAAILDAAWNRLATAWAEPVLGPLTSAFAALYKPFDAPPGGQFGGWHVYMDKDLRSLLGKPVKGAFSTKFCGAGDLAACRESLWAALAATGDELAAAQGSDPSAWRADATAERIKFVPGLLPFTMAYTNRPSGIQQVISFDGHGTR